MRGPPRSRMRCSRSGAVPFEPIRMTSVATRKTCTSGKTEVKPRRMARNSSVPSSYSCTHWQNRPSSASRERASSKKSRVNRPAAPATQGFDGSEMITS